MKDSNENQMQLILEIDVLLAPSYHVRGNNREIVMIPFTGSAKGAYFSGQIIGQGTDTQSILPDGTMHLSARYMLEGIDCAQQPCKVFIENSGSDLDHCTPIIVTDSHALRDWETAALTAKVTPSDNGVVVRIYQIDRG